MQISRVSGASPSFAQFFSPGWSGAGPGEGLSVRARRASGVKLFRLRLKVLSGNPRGRQQTPQSASTSDSILFKSPSSAHTI